MSQTYGKRFQGGWLTLSPQDDSNARANQARRGCPFLTTAQAAYYIGLSRQTLEKMRSRGQGPRFRKHGRYVRYHIDDVDAWSDASACSHGEGAERRRTHVDERSPAPESRRQSRGHSMGLILGASGLGLTAVTAPAPQRPILVYNATASAPVGLYRLLSSTSLNRGDLVLATAPPTARTLAAERGYLPADVPLVKRIAALHGDIVCADGSSISINGTRVAGRLSVDAQDRQLPSWNGCRTLGPDDLFLLMPDVPQSFDSRYFGPIAKEAVRGRLVPLWLR